MSRKRYTPKQIIGMLRQAEVELAQGWKVPGELPKMRQAVCRQQKVNGGLLILGRYIAMPR
jgi:hypothetical protein